MPSLSTNHRSGRAGPPPVVPDHELLCRIGLGSYGEVWMARSVTGALRAVKVVYQESFDSPRPYEREFQGISHFEPVSRAEPGLVDILQVGRSPGDSSFYYVMELADNANGQTTKEGEPASEADNYEPLTLETLLRREGGRLPVHRCVAMGISLARGLGYLHKAGLVHRDIKPSNIIFVGGVPKLADVGLVARLEERKSFVGTEGFFPPEGPGTACADIYGLGKCLYEAAMGRDRQEFPSPASQLQELPDRVELLEFNEIITKACDPDPKNRYQEGAEMLRELELLARGGSVRNFRTRRARLRGVGWALGVILVAAAGTLLWRQLAVEPEDPRVTRAPAYALSVRELQLPFVDRHFTGFAQVDHDKEPELILTSSSGAVAVLTLDGHVLSSWDHGPKYSGLAFDKFEDADGDGVDEWFGVHPDAGNLYGVVFNSGFGEIKRFKFPNYTTRAPNGGERASYLASQGVLPSQQNYPTRALYSWLHAAPNFPRHLIALNWGTGEELWRYSIPGLPSGLIKRDLDGDGLLDILFATQAPYNGYVDDHGRPDSTVYLVALRHDGSELWCQPFAPYFCSRELYLAPIDGKEQIFALASLEPGVRASNGWKEPGFARLARLSPSGEIMASYQATNHLYDLGWAALQPNSKTILLAPNSEGCLEIFDPIDLTLLRRVQVTRPEGGWVQLRLIGIADLDGDGFLEIALGSQQYQFAGGTSIGRSEQGRNIERTLDNRVIILDHNLTQVASFLLSPLRKDRSRLRAAIVDNSTLKCREVGVVENRAIFLRLTRESR